MKRNYHHITVIITAFVQCHKVRIYRGAEIWRWCVSNPGPFACKANALPLNYIPESICKQLPNNNSQTMRCNCTQHIPKLCPGLSIITVITGSIISGRTSRLSDTSSTTRPFNKQAAANVTNLYNRASYTSACNPHNHRKISKRCKNVLVTRCNNNVLYKLIQQSVHDCKTNKLTIS